MNALLFGRNKSEIETLVRKTGFTLVEKNPEFVITYGGDGTLMKAEHAYPGIPKIVLRDSLICKKCSPLSNEEVLQRIVEKQYAVEELIKLEAATSGKTLHAMNDVVVHNKDARHAIRYALSVDNKEISGAIIGDGVVIATPFGSTAYYRSITDSFFELGIGLAFNNSTEPSDHMVLKDESIIKIKILRGPAIIYADNHEDEIPLEKGAEVIIKKSREKAMIVIPKTD
jgi:NAD+ kinase